MDWPPTGPSLFPEDVNVWQDGNIGVRVSDAPPWPLGLLINLPTKASFIYVVLGVIKVNRLVRRHSLTLGCQSKAMFASTLGNFLFLTLARPVAVSPKESISSDVKYDARMRVMSIRQLSQHSSQKAQSIKVRKMHVPHSAWVVEYLECPTYKREPLHSNCQSERNRRIICGSAGRQELHHTRIRALDGSVQIVKGRVTRFNYATRIRTATATINRSNPENSLYSQEDHVGQGDG